MPKSSGAKARSSSPCYPRNPLIEACAALDIRTILCRQERVGVAAIADGYTVHQAWAKKNGCSLAQAGPGIENAFPWGLPGLRRERADDGDPRDATAGAALPQAAFRAADVIGWLPKWSAAKIMRLSAPDLDAPRLPRHAQAGRRPGAGRGAARDWVYKGDPAEAIS